VLILIAILGAVALARPGNGDPRGEPGNAATKNADPRLADRVIAERTSK
jgi:hypothetical protein